MPSNVISVDVEDYFHVEAFSDIVDRKQWSQYPCRVEDNTRRILDLLESCGVKGTFFILGWVAERISRAWSAKLSPAATNRPVTPTGTG